MSSTRNICPERAIRENEVREQRTSKLIGSLDYNEYDDEREIFKKKTAYCV